MSNSSESIGLIQSSLYASGTEYSNIPHDNNNHSDTSAAAGDDDEENQAPPNNDCSYSCQIDVQALLDEIQELKQAAEKQSQHLTQQLLILQEKVQSSSCFNNSRRSAVGATHDQDHLNVDEEEKTEEEERDGDENSRNTTVPPSSSTNSNSEETRVSALFRKVLKGSVCPPHYEHVSGPPSLVYMSHTLYMVFAICYFPLLNSNELALGIGTSAFLLLSVVTSFANYSKKGIVSLVGWFLSFSGAIVFAVACIAFVNINYRMLHVAFGLLIPRHVIELVQVCSTATKQKWGKKTTLGMISSPLLGIIAFSIPLLFTLYRGLFGLHIIILPVHALAQYARIFYTLPKASDSNNTNTKEIKEHDEPETLPDDMLDSYAFMITSDDPKTWNFGFAIFFIQAGLASMILVQMILTDSLVPLDVPVEIKILVTFAQFLGLLLTTFWQTDILTSIRMLSMMWYRPNEEWPWNNIGAKNGKFGTWIDKVLLPNMLRLIQGLLVMATSFVIIVKSDDVIDLFKDFTALILISEIDNIAFRLASQWYFGTKLKNEADKIKEIELTDNTEKSFCRLPKRLFILLLIFTSMVGGWAYFVQGQVSGRFILLSEGLPNCKVEYPYWIGNGRCNNNGNYNTEDCGYDGGDCIEFNEFNAKYPNCDVHNPSNIGDGTCNNYGNYNTEDCGYDGGDCIELNAKYPNCKVDYPYIIGDGKCDGGSYNTEDCDYDGGDCIEFNTKYPNCTVDVPSYIGDGYCDGGNYNTEDCGYDGGDCIEFNENYPNCKVDYPYMIGDGTCDGGIYDTEDCGYDGGDC